MTNPKPKLFIVDGSVDVTGALVSAARQAILLKDSVDTILVLSGAHNVPTERTRAFADVITLPFVLPRKKILNLLFYLPTLLLSSVQLRMAMRSHGCERLQINDFYLLQGMVMRMLGFRGRIVTFVRIDPTRYSVAGRLWLTAARWSSTEMVAVSRFIQTRLGEDFPTRLIYEQVSLDAPATTVDQPSLLFVGNYVVGKGQELAVEAFNRIAERYPTARLRFVGSDMGLDKNKAFRARLEQLARDGPASERIEFNGHSNEIGVYYATAFAALNFSASESFSMTCLEASAAGLPLVATRCGGPEEIVEDGISGFLISVGDVTAMADKMAWLFDHPREAAAMGAAGRVLVAKRFSPERARLALIALLELPPRVA